MASIYDISKLSSEFDKMNRKKVNNNSEETIKSKEGIHTKSSENIQDRADISNESVKLFQLQKESKQYLDLIKNVHLVSDKQLQELKENVLNDFYSENNVVETIAEKVLSMANYKN